jgi:acyl carrier protein
MTVFRTTTADQVVAIVEKMSGTEANRNSHLLDDLELDSLDRVALAMELEDHFGIEISDAEVDDRRLANVEGLIACVERKVALNREGAEL